MTTSRETFEREFERNGEDRVRLELQNGNITGEVAVHASQWLGARAQKAEARRLAVARSTKNAAWVAALAGILAVIVAIFLR